MTPAEYLRELQAPFSFYPYLLKMRDELVKMLGGKMPAELDVIGATSTGAWVDRNYAFLRPRLPARFINRLSDDRVAVGELKAASVNASAYAVPDADDAWVVALQTGLSLLLYKCARTVVATFNLENSRATITILEAGAILGEYLAHYAELGVAFGDDFECAPAQRTVASKITTAAEQFVLCHELSHVLLGHWRSPDPC